MRTRADARQDLNVTHHVWDDSHVEVQNRQNELDGVRQARARAVDLLSGADLVVDFGSGTGTGAAELGAAAIALDSSPVMAATTAKRGIPTCLASVEAVPLRTQSVGGVRCDRVLYHLHHPEHALAEAVRVTRPNGTIVSTHPDHESMVISVPGAPDDLIALTKETRIELNYVNGRVPRLVPKMLLDLGCLGVHTEAFTVVVEDPDSKPYALPHWLRSWRDKGAIDVSDVDLETWDAAIEECRRSGGFFFTLTYLLTYGIVS
jgi:SAM-dependent methyltransferase